MEIPQYIKEIRSVHFSLAGQAAASAFSDYVVRAADAKLAKNKGTITNRAAYFFKICHEVCRERNIHPDKMTAAALHEELGTNERMPLTLSSGLNPSILAKPTDRLPDKKKEPEREIDNPFTAYYASLSPDQRAVYDNDPPFAGYRHCTPDELALRRAQFVAIPVPDAVFKILPMGYAERVFNNLRFIPLKDVSDEALAKSEEIPKSCPCTYRRKFNKEYECFVHTCPFAYQETKNAEGECPKRDSSDFIDTRSEWESQ